MSTTIATQTAQLPDLADRINEHHRMFCLEHGCGILRRHRVRGVLSTGTSDPRRGQPGATPANTTLTGGSNRAGRRPRTACHLPLMLERRRQVTSETWQTDGNTGST